MSLPGEMQARAQIAAKYGKDFADTDAVLSGVVKMLNGGSWDITKARDLNGNVTYVILALFTKACKTYRALRHLCEAGLGEDASILLRSLFENTIAILFILQENVIERAEIYQTHCLSREVVILREWLKTPALNRLSGLDGTLAAQEARLDSWLRRVPSTVSAKSVKDHWSGCGSTEEVTKRLDAHDLYQTVFRFTSRFVHATDFGTHIRVDTDGTASIKLVPDPTWIRESMLFARHLLLLAATQIDDRFGLSHSAQLDALKPLTRVEPVHTAPTGSKP